MNMKRVNGNMLADIKAVESNLAREENRELEDIAQRFPKDHPIREEYVKMKVSVGELSNLPPNHPFILMLKDAKRQIEHQENPAEAERESEASRREHIAMKAKKMKAQQDKRIKEEEDKAIRRMAASQVNIQLSRFENSLGNLYETVLGLKDDLSGDPYANTKLIRLERMMSLVKKTIGDCKFSNARMM